MGVTPLDLEKAGSVKGAALIPLASPDPDLVAFRFKHSSTQLFVGEKEKT
jgi:hypothetical protein